jgi:serine/threonine protein kinase
MTTPEEPVPLGTVGDRYVLVELLASDARHETWRGHDDLAGRQVAITRYLSNDDNWRTAFDRRACQLEALSDPGIASVLTHDANDDAPWLATTYVDGETVSALAADPGLTSDDALAVLGQTAFALAAAHGAGIGHGSLDSDRIQVRSDGSIALLGFAMATPPSLGGDLTALAALAHQLLDDAAATDTDVTDLLRLLDAGDWSDPADIARTTLALAAAQRVGSDVPVRPTEVTADESTPEPPRPWYDEDERKRVRNRLIALGVIVVLGGGALLRIFTAGAGETSVPSVIGVPYVEAIHDLNEQGLRGNETFTTGRAGTEGTVIVQYPTAGQRVKVGTVVDLTVVAVGSS